MFVSVLVYFNLTNLLAGRHYLEKYRHDKSGKRTHLMKAEHVKSFLNSEVVIHKWIGDVRNYVMQVDPELIQDKSMIFLMEAQIFYTYTKTSRELCVVVS